MLNVLFINKNAYYLFMQNELPFEAKLTTLSQDKRINLLKQKYGHTGHQNLSNFVYFCAA